MLSTSAEENVSMSDENENENCCMHVTLTLT
jgi:hypothetical protein